MPELPEVEVIRRGLAAGVIGRQLAQIERVGPHGARALRRHVPGPGDFTSRAVGQQITDVRRRGKYLWWVLASGDAVLAHLGMSGQFRLRGAADPPHHHTRLRFCFADGGPVLDFDDQRTFGSLQLVSDGAELPAPIAHIARDPLDAAFDRAATLRVIRGKRSGIKRVLLDQSVVSGIGNIYADEALWAARAHYDQPAETMSTRRVGIVLDAAADVMHRALAHGGTSFDALYVAVNGESGYFERSLNAYGRAGEPCLRCGSAMVREKFMNRSSFRCPRCQPRR